MNGGRVVDPRGDTQPPWDGTTERRARPSSSPSCEIAEEALREVRELSLLLNGHGGKRGLFELQRSMEKSNEDMAQQVRALDAKLGTFDHKLDETVRNSREQLLLAKEELLLAKEEARLANEQLLLAKKASARQAPMWMTFGSWVSVILVGAFFAVKLWKELFGP
jgi:hypothetical protein